MSEESHPQPSQRPAVVVQREPGDFPHSTIGSFPWETGLTLRHGPTLPRTSPESQETLGYHTEILVQKQTQGDDPTPP